MNFIRRNLIWVLVAVAVLGIVMTLFQGRIADAAGHIGIYNVLPVLRTKMIEVPLYVLDNGSNTTDTTAGREGVLATTTLNGVTSITMTTFEPPPYPCKIELVAKEATAGGTLTCTGDVTISGRNQFGTFVTETITSDIVETTP